VSVACSLRGRAIGLLTNLLVGIAGSFIGGTLAGLLNIEFHGWLGNLLVATIGAVLVLWLWRSVAYVINGGDLRPASAGAFPPPNSTD
jgi:uncharacterized membrane protein YeaQ/YmgE (transglycosylase-associated protein family)